MATGHHHDNSTYPPIVVVIVSDSLDAVDVIPDGLSKGRCIDILISSDPSGMRVVGT